MSIQNNIKIKSNNILFLLLLLLSYSCISQRKLEYVRSRPSFVSEYNKYNIETERIKTNDELYIRVSSFDDVNFNFFNNQSDIMRMNYGNEISVTLISYTVDDSGYIYFPLLQKVYVKDMTLLEVTYKLQNLLSEYFNQPTVIVKFVNKKISVIGEVRMPGYYSYSKNNISIFEALAMAGDITSFGNRKRAYIIREDSGIIKKFHVNLCSENILENQNYYLKENDILYIPPRSNKMWDVTSTPWQLILSSVTTLILVINFVLNN
jgi:polysaccharide export outer membrane protein